MNPSTINLENSIGPSFALAQGESILLPYGDYRHKEGLQRVDATAAERMALALSGLVGKIKRLAARARKDLPIYIGHPDAPGRGAEFPDKRAYGWVTSIAAENDGTCAGPRPAAI